MKQAVEAILRSFGDTLDIVHGETSTTVRAFLQPVTSKSWQNMEHMFSDLGRIERGQYLYLGPADKAVEQGDLLRCQDRDYLVRKAERISVADLGLYQWALCVRKGGDDPWNS